MPKQTTSQAPTRVRYIVLALTVAVYLITYLDRTLLSAAAPSMQKEMGFSLQTLGWILASYQIGYSLFQIPGGWLGDRLGPRIALAGVVVWWSAFTALTTLTWSVQSLIVVMFLFGAGEAGAFPIATRSLSRWILPAERGFAQGITHAGSRFGGAITPVMAVFLMAQFGWRIPFLIFAIPGLVWAAIWLWYYRDTPQEHKGVNDAERNLIEAGLGARQMGRKEIPWGAIMASRRMWILAAMYFCYGVVMLTFLTWFPKYLSAARHLDLKHMGIFASVPLAAAVVGDICGGVFSDLLLKRTGKITFSRRVVAVTGFAIAGLCIPIAVTVADPIVSIVFFSMSLFALELTVGNSWAVTLDIGGSHAGSVSAVMSMFGNIGGAIYAAIMGYVVTAYSWHVAFYGLAAFAILGAALFAFIDVSRPLALPGGRVAEAV
ncbi:MAG: MFS transporter [Caulobacteraceae bacterium]